MLPNFANNSKNKKKNKRRFTPTGISALKGDAEVCGAYPCWGVMLPQAAVGAPFGDAFAVGKTSNVKTLTITQVNIFLGDTTCGWNVRDWCTGVRHLDYLCGRPTCTAWALTSIFFVKQK